MTPTDFIGRDARTPSPGRHRVATGLVVSLCLVLALWAGLWIRATAWRVTTAIRFGPDLNSAYHWGTQAQQWGGYLRVYDEEQARNPGQKLLDYPPLRLLIVTRWVEGLRRTHPHFDGRTWSRGVVKPLLRVNLVAELATALGIFLLVRTWLRRRSTPPFESGARPAPSTSPRRTLMAGVNRVIGWTRLESATARGLAAALLFWFNPAVILNSHVFPQWDVWLLPFFVFGVLVATSGWWFGAGALVAVGSMLKGQMLLVAALFLLWPLFSRQWGAMLRWLGGFAAAAAVVVAPWLLGSRGGTLWVLAVLLALVLARAWTGCRPGSWRAGAAVLLLLVSTLGPWLLVPGRAGLWLGLLFAGALVGATYVVPAGQTRYLAAFAVAAGLGICGVAFEGSFGWFYMGFHNQATRSPFFISNVGTPGRILHDFFSSPADRALLGPLVPGSGMGPPIGRPLAVGHVFVLTYVAALVSCAWAAARHARRQDPRFLIAVVTPWVLLFTLLPNVRTRYLVWGASLTAVAPGVGWGAMLLHVIITASAFENVLRPLLARSLPPLVPKLQAALNAVHPNGGWLVLAFSVALFWVAMRPSPDRPRVVSGADDTGRA